MVVGRPVRTRVKVCGITRPEDGAWAGACGADAIGLVFYPPSPRSVEVEQARGVVASLPPFVSVVGLFVDPEPEWVRRVLEAVPVDLLQFHGDEPPEACEAYGRPYMKALSMGEGVDPRGVARRYRSSRALLLDSFREGVRGGTGTPFDWSRVPGDLDLPLVLAGGLDPGNVARAVGTVRPYGVDVSSGVEASKGVKDPARVEAFMREVLGASVGE